LLIIDEIYIAKRVEYGSGKVQRLTADGNIASCRVKDDNTTSFIFVIKLAYITSWPDGWLS